VSAVLVGLAGEFAGSLTWSRALLHDGTTAFDEGKYDRPHADGGCKTQFAEFAAVRGPALLALLLLRFVRWRGLVTILRRPNEPRYCWSVIIVWSSTQKAAPYVPIVVVSPVCTSTTNRMSPVA
jgi:hypothetical protein